MGGAVHGTTLAQTPYTQQLVRVEGKIDGANYMAILEENLLVSSRDWQRFTFDNSKYTVNVVCSLEKSKPSNRRCSNAPVKTD